MAHMYVMYIYLHAVPISQRPVVEEKTINTGNKFEHWKARYKGRSQ